MIRVIYILIKLSNSSKNYNKNVWSVLISISLLFVLSLTLALIGFNFVINISVIISLAIDCHVNTIQSYWLVLHIPNSRKLLKIIIVVYLFYSLTVTVKPICDQHSVM